MRERERERERVWERERKRERERKQNPLKMVENSRSKYSSFHFDEYIKKT